MVKKNILKLHKVHAKGDVVVLEHGGVQEGNFLLLLLFSSDLKKHLKTVRTGSD